MTVKAVLIDIDNTLLDFDKSAFKAINSVAERQGVILPENHFGVFLRVNDYLWGLLQDGKIKKPFIYENRFRMIFSELDISGDFRSFEEEFRAEMRTTAIPVDGASEITEYLSGKYPVYSASNASRLQQIQRLEASGLMKYLSGMFNSESIGAEKPSPVFFDYCLNALSPLRADEIVMIGDSYEADIEGADKAGLNAIWFNFRKEEKETAEGILSVSSLYEIKNIL